MTAFSRGLVIALGACVAAVAAPCVEGDAAAQVWKPKKPKKPAPKKKKPSKKKPAPKPAPEPVAEPEPEPEPVTEPEPEPEEAAPEVGEEEEWEEEEDEEEGEEDAGDTVRIDDELDDVGADVTFSASDLASDAADGTGATRLETKALGYGRLGADTIHDPPPRVGGRKATGEDVLEFRAHGRAEGTSRFGERVKVKVSGRADAELGLDSDTQIGTERYEAQIWDTYADLYTSWLDVRFGKQLITWGTADLLSPNDVVNPRDLRRGIALQPDELRLPILALSATAFSGPLSLQGAWIPVAPTNRFDLLDGDYAILGPHAATDVERRVGAMVSALADDPMLGIAVSPILAIGDDPGNGIDTGELAASGSIQTRRFDLHGYFLWGHERSPRIRIAEELREFLIMTPPEMLTPEVFAERIQLLAMEGTAAVLVDQPRRTHAGVAMATRIEPIGVKLDAGYTPAAATVLVADGTGPVLGEVRRLAQATGVVSLDYDRGTELSAVVEVSHTRVLDVPEGAEVFQMTEGDHLTVVGAQLSWNPDAGPITVSGLGFVDVDAPSYAIRPAIELSGHDHWSVEIAATLYGGPSGTLGGINTDADQVTLTVQYGL